MRRQTVIPLYINSIDRTNINDQTTDYVISLRKPLRNIVSISVTNVVIPITYNAVNRNNNTINAYIFIKASVSSVTIYTPLVATLVDGNYSPSELASVFQDALNHATTSQAYGFQYAVTYDPVTFRMTIEVVNPEGIYLYQWGIEFTYTPCIDIIGIGFGGTSNQTYTATGNTAFLTIPCGRTPANGTPYSFNITSNLLTNGINTSYVSSLVKTFNITAANDVVNFIVQEPADRPFGNVIPFPTSATGGVFFGQIVGISHDGNITISNAMIYNITSSFIFTRLPQTTPWVLRSDPILGVPASSSPLIRKGGNCISGDGNTMVLGVPYLDNNRGGAMVFRRVGTNWVLTDTVIPELASTQQMQGLNVSISADGVFLSISSSYNLWLLRYSSNAWIIDVNRFYGPSGTTELIRYLATSADGTTIVVACPGWFDIWYYASGWTFGGRRSAAYPSIAIAGQGTLKTIIYSNNFQEIHTLTGNGSSWVEGNILYNPSFDAGFGFGLSLSLAAERLVTTNPVTRELYIYQFASTIFEWVLTATFTGINGVPYVGYPLSDIDYCSTALSSDANTLIAGSPYDSSDPNGKSYIYTKVGLTWSLVEAITNTSSVGALSRFGSSISIDGNYAAIGSTSDGVGGSVFIYKYLNSWVEYGVKIPGPNRDYDTFGNAVSIATVGTDDIFILIGNKGVIPNLGSGGEVSLYRMVSGNVTFVTDFVGFTVDVSTLYGSSVALSYKADAVLIGGPGINFGDGRVWFWFEITGSGWFQALIDQPIYRAGNNFGKAVAFSTTKFVILSNTYVTISSYEPYTGIYVTVDISVTYLGIVLSDIDIAMDDSTIVVGAAGHGALVLNYNSIATTFLSYPSVGVGSMAGQSVSISRDAKTIVVGDPGYNGGVGGTYVYNYIASTNSWVIFGDIASGGYNVGYNLPEQGSAVEMFGNDKYLTSGSVANNNSGSVWYFTAIPTFETTYSLSILEPYEVIRSFTVFGLISVFNFVLTPFLRMEATFVADKYVLLTLVSTTGATFRVSDTSTFKYFLWPSDVLATTQQSDEIDFSINNNIVKSSVNTVSNVFSGFFTDSQQNENYRVYPAGYTIQNDIDIQLRDERDRIIDLNGANWTCVLLATIAN